MIKTEKIIIILLQLCKLKFGIFSEYYCNSQVIFRIKNTLVNIVKIFIYYLVVARVDTIGMYLNYNQYVGIQNIQG